MPILNFHILWTLRRVIHPIIKSSDNVYLLSRDDGVSHGKTPWTFFPTRFMSPVFNRDWLNEDDHACEVCGVCVCVCVAVSESRNWVKYGAREGESEWIRVTLCSSHKLIFFMSLHVNLTWGKRLPSLCGSGWVVWCRINWPRHENPRPGVWVCSVTLESHVSSLWGGLSFLICKTVNWMRDSRRPLASETPRLAGGLGER